MLKVDIASQNALSNEGIVHFDMLCTRVEHWVPSQIDILLSHTTSRAAIAPPLYSASVLKREMVGCFLLLQDIAPLPREKTNPGGRSSIGFVAGPIGICVPLESYWHRGLVDNVAIHCAAHVW